MFTGIVRELGRIVGREGARDGVRLRVQAPDSAAGTATGDSVAVSGVCLTAERVDADVIEFHAGPETLERTSLAALEIGDEVNLEPALRVGDPLGGHLVQGHVDGVGRIQSVEAEGEGLRAIVEAAPDILRYCVEKGSITVDGVSLTVAEIHDDTFGVALVPHTLAVTTLATLLPGSVVNLEVDVLAKYVERLAAAPGVARGSGA
jgi:riboflavin synthase